jgi:hypothetical protein
MTRGHRGAAGGFAIVLLAPLIACSGDGGGALDGNGAGVSPTSAPSEERTTSSTVPDASTSTMAAGRVITVAVSGGRVENGFQRLKLLLGEPVVVRVTSDTADEVHLQGYERKVDVAAGGTAEIAFTPDVPGVFLVELVEDRLKLLELEIR